MNIKTERTYQPRPAPAWLAIDDDSYDGPGSPIGEGATEEEAQLDLFQQVAERPPYLDPDRLREDWLERRRLEREP